jgi:hypothetical protein
MILSAAGGEPCIQPSAKGSQSWAAGKGFGSFMVFIVLKLPDGLSP